MSTVFLKYGHVFSWNSCEVFRPRIVIFVIDPLVWLYTDQSRNSTNIVLTIVIFVITFRFGHNAKIVHFLGPVKPWSSSSGGDAGHSDTMGRFVTLWWKEYLSHTVTKSTPREQPRQEQGKPQQVQRQEVKRTFQENLDRSESLLAHFAAPAAPSEPPMVNNKHTTHYWSVYLYHVFPPVPLFDLSMDKIASWTIYSYLIEQIQCRPLRLLKSNNAMQAIISLLKHQTWKFNSI